MTDTGMIDKLQREVQAITRTAVAADESLLRSGRLDSLNLLRLAAFVETEFHVDLSDRLRLAGVNFDTINELAALIAAAPAAKPVAVPAAAPGSAPAAAAAAASAVADRQSWWQLLRREPWTWYYRRRLRRAGARVGPGLHVSDRIFLTLHGRPENIVIGANVRIGPGVSIWLADNGRLVIGDNVNLCPFVRLNVIADGNLVIGADAHVGPFTIMNALTGLQIGRGAGIGGHVYINTVEHGIRRGITVLQQPNITAPVHIGDDVMLGGHVSVLCGARLGDGAIIGANSVVNGEVPANAICYGIPARLVKFREP